MDQSLPPDLHARVSDLERQLRDLQRAQNPVAPRVFALDDVSGQPSTSGSIMEYDRLSGEWKPGLPVAAGDVKWSASNVVPPGRWLLADGAAVSRTDYAELFTAIGTIHGAGNGSTTFNLPNLSGKLVIGAGTDALGSTGGARTHTLTVAEMPGHTHPQNVSAAFGGAGVRTDYDADAASDPFPQGINTGSTGGGGAHNNMPPYIALWGYIRY